MEPWFKIAVPRREVREGRSFSPDELPSHLEQVVAGTAPEDYSKPEQFFRAQLYAGVERPCRHGAAPATRSAISLQWFGRRRRGAGRADKHPDARGRHPHQVSGIEQRRLAGKLG